MTKKFPPPLRMRIPNFPLPCGGGLRGWVRFTKNSNAKFSNSDFTHPQTPSAREGA
ncbi:hypothetical protein [Helicobacter sp. 23-1045]